MNHMSPITLNLPESILAELASAARESHLSPEAVAEEMLKRMVWLRRFERLRGEVRASLGPDAPTSEDEIFAQIS